MRIASLLPAASEIACAVGLGDDLVAVTFECDHPAGLRRYVAEQRDDLRRALAARAVPGAPR